MLRRWRAGWVTTRGQLYANRIAGSLRSRVGDIDPDKDLIVEWAGILEGVIDAVQDRSRPGSVRTATCAQRASQADRQEKARHTAATRHCHHPPPDLKTIVIISQIVAAPVETLGAGV